MERIGDAMGGSDVMCEIRRRIEEKTGRPFDNEAAGKLIPSTGELIAKSRERSAQALIRRAHLLSEVGPRFETRTYAAFRVTPENEAAYSAAQAVTRGQRFGVGLYGPPGTGKTHLAGSIANAAISAGQAAICAPVHDLLSLIRESYDSERDAGESQGERAIVRRCADVPVLILDDLGKELVTAWSLATLYAIVNARYSQNRGIVITSNLSLRDLNARYAATHVRGVDPTVGPAIIDRIVEMTAPVPWIHLVGLSHRHMVPAAGDGAA
jgi:DNA replication protein DnaC